MKYYYKIKEKSIFILTAIVFTLFFYAGTDICCADEENINPDQCIISSGFEESYDFSVWKPFGSDTAKLEADSSKSHSGNYSLKISGRNSSYEGPSVSLNDITEAGDTYHVSVWFSYSGESPDSMRLSLKESFSDKKDKFTTIASQDNVNPDQWIKIEGDFSVSENAADALLYLESSIDSNILWIDDVTIYNRSISITKPSGIIKPDGTTVLDFETPCKEIMSKRNSKIVRSDTFSRHGEYSVCVTGRTDCLDGVSASLSGLHRNKPYRCSAAVTFSDRSIQSESFSMYIEYYINNTLYNIPVEENHPADRGSWSLISGKFTIPENASDPIITIVTARPKDEHNYNHIAFYVDDLTISDELETAIEKAQSKNKTKITVIASISALLISVIMIFLLRRQSRARKKIINAATDSMTGTLNRNAYEEKIRYLELNPEKCRKVHLAVCDLNGLKEINDRFGHKAGDECLIKCASILIAVLEQYNGKVYRTGGDEFVCISKRPFRDDLLKYIDAAEKSSYEYPFSIAAGFSSYKSGTDGEIPDIKQMITRCDKEMYKNKTEKKSNKK